MNKFYCHSICFLFTLLCLLFPLEQFAQSMFGNGAGVARPTVEMIILNHGDLKAIKDVTQFNLVFDYSGMRVSFFKTEEEFMTNKEKELSAKGPEKVEIWKTGWINAKKEKYPPAFERNLNKVIAKRNMKATLNADSSKYTLMVKTLFIEPGLYYGLGYQNSYVSFKYEFYQTGNPEPLLTLIEDNVNGRYDGPSFAEARIAGGYSNAGRLLGNYILKALKDKK